VKEHALSGTCNVSLLAASSILLLNFFLGEEEGKDSDARLFSSKGTRSGVMVSPEARTAGGLESSMVKMSSIFWMILCDAVIASSGGLGFVLTSLRVRRVDAFGKEPGRCISAY
jgi:hypothetical protein